MSKESKFGTPYKRKDGHIGARAKVRADHEGWAGRYEFDTHGMKSAEVAAKIEALEARHAAKADRLTGFRDLQGTEVDGFRIVDCTLQERGRSQDGWLLYIDVRPKVAGFPIKRRIHRIEDVPVNEAIVEMIRAALPPPTEDLNALHDEFVAKVNAKLGGEVG